MTSQLLSVDGRIRVSFVDFLSVGRHLANGLVIPLATVSNRHAVIEWVGRGWRVRDLNSRNGTRLDGTRLERTADLHNGAVLRFGGSRDWRLNRLLSPHTVRGRRGAIRVHRVDAPSNRPTRLLIHPAGPGEGTVKIFCGRSTHTFHGGRLYALLDTLAEQPGEWVAHDSLRARMWGRISDHLQPAGLQRLLDGAQDDLDACESAEPILERERDRSRLALGSDRVRRVTSPTRTL